MPVFLCTDVEDLTQLWERHTTEMPNNLARRDAIVLQHVAAYGGRIAKQAAGGVTAVFEAGRPLSCALETHKQLADQDWGAIGALHVRTALHAGAAELRAGDYVGAAVDCAARILAAGWGGQILLTPDVARSADVPPRATLQDLGDHLIKDVSGPQRIYRLGHPDLPQQDFPPLRTVSGSTIGRLIRQQGQRLLHLAPSATAIGLVSAALLPAILGDLSPSAPALAGVLGVLGDLGLQTLSGFAGDFLQDLTKKQRAGHLPGETEVQRQLEQALLERWEAGGEVAAALRADVSQLLQVVQGVEAALSAATDDMRHDLARGLADLGGSFQEFGWMLDDLQHTMAEIHSRQIEQMTLQREQLDLQRQQLEKTDLLLRLQAARQRDEATGDATPLEMPKAQSHNLPAQPNALIGREKEMIAIRERLLREDVRLVTLTGPGGIGKTRLSLEVATGLVDDFDRGVFLVLLAPVADPGLVLPTIAQTLGVRQTGSEPFLESLTNHLQDKRMLLLLDNFEQVVSAAPLLSKLLAACPKLKLLVTSREVLRLRSEHDFPVPPLTLPDPERLTALGADPSTGSGHALASALSQYEAVELFIQRAQAVKPDFTINNENAPAVAEICTRLDGLPLAIELAAARIKLLSPQAMLKRLESRLKLLRGGARDLPERHQTLRGAIAWSHGLLDPAERTLFQRLSVFVGGCTLEAAEVVCDADGSLAIDILDGIASLVDKSLLRQVENAEGESRFVMMETIREFALEELENTGEMAQVAARHAFFFAALAEEVEPHLTRQGQVTATDRLSADQANFRAALRFCVEFGEVETGLRIGAALWRFWQAIGQLPEGRRWLEQLLSRPEASPGVRAKGLTGLAGLAYWLADYEEALAHYREALELYRNLRDRFNEADTLLSMSTTSTWSGNTETGNHLADQALVIFEELGVREKVGMGLMAKGFACWKEGDLQAARPLWEESLAIAREVGDHAEAATKSLALASIVFQQGQRDQALRSTLDAMEELIKLKNVTFTVMSLDFVAAMVAHGSPEDGVRLAGAAAALRAALGGGMRPEASGLESTRDTAGRHLDAETIERAWESGQQMDLDQTIEYAREVGAAMLTSGSSGESEYSLSVISS